jgi:hypothetical protein
VTHLEAAINSTFGSEDGKATGAAALKELKNSKVKV